MCGPDSSDVISGRLTRNHVVSQHFCQDIFVGQQFFEQVRGHFFESGIGRRKYRERALALQSAGEARSFDSRDPRIKLSCVGCRCEEVFCGRLKAQAG